MPSRTHVVGHEGLNPAATRSALQRPAPSDRSVGSTLGDQKEAESTLKELAPVVRRVLGPIHPTTREVESTLSVIARYRNAAGGGNLRIVIAGAT